MTKKIDSHYLTFYQPKKKKNLCTKISYQWWIRYLIKDQDSLEIHLGKKKTLEIVGILLEFFFFFYMSTQRNGDREFELVTAS